MSLRGYFDMELARRASKFWVINAENAIFLVRLLTNTTSKSLIPTYLCYSLLKSVLLS